MMKERAIAIFFGAIMILSAAGFALSGASFMPQGGATPAVSNIVDKALTKDEFRSVLLSGRTIIQNHYPLGCTDCESANTMLKSLANQMSDFIVLEQFTVQYENETVLQIVSSDGKITELNRTGLNESSLLDSICSASYVQPKECLLREV
jgi:hypothetical protein